MRIYSEAIGYNIKRHVISYENRTVRQLVHNIKDMSFHMRIVQ